MVNGLWLKGVRRTSLIRSTIYGGQALRRNASGQAIIELCVCLVAVMAILVAILQLNSITMAQTDSMVEARQRAAEGAMADWPLLPLPGFLYSWDESTDGKRYTADDEFINANSGDFSSAILAKAAKSELEWEALNAADSDVSVLANEGLNPSLHFGLIKGEADTRTIDLMKSFQHLIYNKPSVSIDSEVWMTWTKGIY